MKRIVSLLLIASFCLGGSAEAALNFDEALKTILARDTEIASQKSLTSAVEAGGMTKHYYLLPTLSLDGSRRWQDTHEEITSFTANATMNLFRFGADHQGSEAQHSLETAAQAKLDQTRLDREKFAVQTLVNYLGFVHEADILGQLEKMQLESQKVAQRQYDTGRIPVQEVQKITIDLENVRSRVAANDIALSDAKAALLTLLGSTDVATEWPWKDRITKISAPNHLRATSYLSVRPDWIQVKSTDEAQEHLASQAFRTMLPTVDASFAYGTTRDRFLADSYQPGWVGTLSVSIPIFNRFEQYSAYRAQAETRGSTEALLEDTKRKIEGEFTTVPTRFETAKRTALSREEILKISEKLYQDNLLRYRQGHANSNELNIDLNRYLETQLNAVSGWQAAHLALVDLFHLTGKSVLSSAL